jgi:hypothetical protein
VFGFHGSVGWCKKGASIRQASRCIATLAGKAAPQKISAMQAYSPAQLLIRPKIAAPARQV